VLRLTLNDLQNREELPSEDPVLYLQIDNCGENKNKVMFSFLTDLVRRGIFSKVKAGFLMVGHTHEDIDQLVSTIAHYFKAYKTCCADPESLAEEIRNAFTDAKHKPTVVLLHPISKQIFDYKQLYRYVYAAVLDPKITTSVCHQTNIWSSSLAIQLQILGKQCILAPNGHKSIPILKCKCCYAQH
jgi:hypothetical protein